MIDVRWPDGQLGAENEGEEAYGKVLSGDRHGHDGLSVSNLRISHSPRSSGVQTYLLIVVLLELDLVLPPSPLV